MTVDTKLEKQTLIKILKDYLKEFQPHTGQDLGCSGLCQFVTRRLQDVYGPYKDYIYRCRTILDIRIGKYVSKTPHVYCFLPSPGKATSRRREVAELIIDELEQELQSDK